MVKLPLPDKVEDSKKVNVKFPKSTKIEAKIVDYAIELDNYGVQSYVRTQDYVKVFMRANALLNIRSKVTKSDLYLYDLIHPLFLNSMGELGTENFVLALIKNHPQTPDKELIDLSGISKGTFYKYRKIIHSKGAI
ncbi:MAG: hypothetical protein ABSD41_09505 [Candidatus Bathyarchaeia archaeon]